MYPYEFIKDTGINLYVILIVSGVVAALATLRFLSTPVKLPAKIFNFLIIVAVVSIIVGWFFAMLFQAVYRYIDTGEFSFGGQTFLGGLIGGAAVFFFVYFVIGGFIFSDGEHKKQFSKILTIAMPAIVIGHALGRIGCLTAGCCYGEVTDAWYGIYMYSHGAWAKRVPTQLFEALFLFALFAVMIFLIIKRKLKNTASLYLISYGIWRFAIEFVRADTERSESFIKGLYPSQLISVVMVIFGIALIFVYDKIIKEPIENE